jgi:ParB family transcriptional regulator, chromosome partitioning protein
VAQTLDGSLTTPEALSQAQIEALALALRRGMADLIDEVLKLHRLQPLALQMQALKPVLTESAQLTDADAEITRRTGTPRRLMRLPQGLTIRREQTAKGWLLHFSGPEARPGALMDDVFRLIEMTFTPNH